MRFCTSFWRKRSRRKMALPPGAIGSGWRPPVRISSAPITDGTDQSELHITRYSSNSPPLSEYVVKGTLPKRRQYRVTPRAQMSMDLVIGGRGCVMLWRVVVLLAEEWSSVWELRGELVEYSQMTSGARKDGVPALFERSESSIRMASGSSFSAAFPAAASRCA